MELPNPGSYTARQNGKVMIVQEESGSLMAYIPYALMAVSFSGTHTLCLVKKDGDPMGKNIQTLKAVFPNWDHENLADIEMPDQGDDIPQFELADCWHDDSYTPEGAESPVVKFVAKWLNTVGGLRKVSMTDDERKACKAKFGAKFKALLSAPKTQAKAAAPAKAAPAAPAAKAKVSGPPGRKSTGAMARTSTAEEVWANLEKWNADQDTTLSEDDLASKYYDACDAVEAGSSADPALLDTPTKWGKVADELGI